MIRTFLASACLLLILGACCKDETPTDISQPVLFEYEFINHAWVYTHMGWLIDAEGNVLGYNLPGNWNEVDAEGYIGKSEVIENLSQTDTMYFKVDNQELLENAKHRFDLPGARVDTSDQYMADAGIGVLYVYVWDTEVEKYNRVLLASRGDIRMTNTHPKVKSIVSWLEGVGNQTDRFFWFDD